MFSSVTTFALNAHLKRYGCPMISLDDSNLCTHQYIYVIVYKYTVPKTIPLKNIMTICLLYIYIYIFMYVYIYIYVCMYVCNPKHSTSKIKIQLFCLLYVVMLKSSVVRFVQRVPNTGSSKVLQEATNRNSFKWSLVWCRPRSLR